MTEETLQRLLPTLYRHDDAHHWISDFPPGHWEAVEHVYMIMIAF